MDSDQASVELCAVEAVTNAIKHAYRGAGGHEVSVEVSFTRERLDLDVRDQGMVCPRRKREAAAAPASLRIRSVRLEAIPEGGMGLEIIRREMDETSYIRQRVDSIV